MFPSYRDSNAPLHLSSGSDVEDPATGYHRQALLSPHNLYWLVLSEQGLIGALALGGFLLGLGVLTWRRTRREAGPLGLPDGRSPDGRLRRHRWSGHRPDVGLHRSGVVVGAAARSATGRGSVVSVQDSDVREATSGLIAQHGSLGPDARCTLARIAAAFALTAAARAARMEIRVGSHTLSPVRLPDADADVVRREAIQSRERLEAIVATRLAWGRSS